MSRQPRSEKVILADVALRAGVSAATVSKVLNGRSDVSARTREHVLGVVAETGYRPTTPRHDRPLGPALVVVLDFVASPYAGHGAPGDPRRRHRFGHRTAAPPAGPDDSAGTSAARDWVAEQQAAGVIGIIELAVAVPDAVLTAANDRNCRS